MNIILHACWAYDEYDNDIDEYFFHSFEEIYQNVYFQQSFFHRPYTMVVIQIDQSDWVYCDDWEDIHDLEQFISNRRI